MSKEFIYIDYDEALNIYGKMIDASDGGFEGVRDEGGIRATLDFVQNDLYYPTFADKLTYLMYRFCSGHFFNDGNKRIALTVGTYFLQKSYIRAKCKLQQLQTAKGVVYCSFSYSPRFTFLIILFVARLTKEYITDLPDNPTSFPA